MEMELEFVSNILWMIVGIILNKIAFVLLALMNVLSVLSQVLGVEGDDCCVHLSIKMGMKMKRQHYFWDGRWYWH